MDEVTPIFAFLIGVAFTAAAVWALRTYRSWRERISDDDDAAPSQISTVSQLLNLAVQGSPTGIAIFNRGARVIMSNARAHDMSSA